MLRVLKHTYRDLEGRGQYDQTKRRARAEHVQWGGAMYADGARSLGAYAASSSVVPSRSARTSNPVVCRTWEQRRIGPTRDVVAPATGHISPGYNDREGSERTRRRNLG